VDDALKSTIDAHKDTLKEMDNRFKKAIDALSDYEKKHYSSKIVAKRMAAAAEGESD
jgi:hypothetical protein